MASSSKNPIEINSSDEEDHHENFNCSDDENQNQNLDSGSDEENPQEIIWQDLGCVNPKFFRIYIEQRMSKKLRVPIAFQRYYRKRKIPGLFILRNRFRHPWEVKVEYMEDHFWMTTGWTKFVTDNSVNFGELMVFERTGFAQLDVDIFSVTACLKPDIYSGHGCASTSGAAAVANKKVIVVKNQAGVPQPIFYDIVIGKTHLSKKYMPILHKFWGSREYSKRARSGKVRLRMGGKSWKVGLKKEANRVWLKENVMRFLEDNGLRVGNEIRFELVAREKELTMDVSLLT